MREHRFPPSDPRSAGGPIRVGYRVRLGEFDNGDEVIPSEEGTVLKIQDGEMITVLVDSQYRDVEGDDGLRECDVDQVEEVLQL